MKKIILIILISFSSVSVLKADFIAPLIRVSYDFNLGYTTSIGVTWNKTEGGEVGGVYILYSFSHKKNKALIDGKNFSAGAYGGIGVVSFRIGVNNMIIKHVNNSSLRGGIHSFNKFSDRFLIQQPGSYWGLEVSPQIIIGNGCIGIISTQEGYKLNGSLGLGIF